MLQQYVAILSKQRMQEALTRKGAERIWRQGVFFRSRLNKSSRIRSLNNIRTNPLIKLPIKLGGVKMTALLDSRAQLSYMSSRAV